MTEIIVTKDGSHSLLNTELNETYHSVHGALQESIYVFIKNGLDPAIQKNPDSLSILEVGFGTGLNALLTLQRAQQVTSKIQYTTLEAFPLTEDIWSRLNYAESLRLQEHFNQLHRAPWNVESSILPNFQLLKIDKTLQTVDLNSTYDLIYFDAFAPSKQPEMWTLDVLGKVVNLMKPAGIFVTYCAKGQLKRDLKSLGLNIETLPGPPGKKEMVRGVSNS
ncbi:MAG TPA: tRNA (5-methylaminomethyl-2-thiouridine)(34)-methyltransferase MnmD [Ohtaekwangia sp.]